MSAVLTPLGHLPGRRREVFLMVKRSLVSVVDDDESVRESLPDLLTRIRQMTHNFVEPDARFRHYFQ